MSPGLALAAILLGAAQPLLAQTEVEVFRAKTEQWVKSRQLISEEKTEWEAEQQILRATRDLLEQQREALAAEMKAWVQERGIKFPVLFQPLRCALSGQPGGRDLFEIMGLLGPQRTLLRIREGARRLAAPAAARASPLGLSNMTSGALSIGTMTCSAGRCCSRLVTVDRAAEFRVLRSSRILL